jgi:CIC family chloride channel protein
LRWLRQRIRTAAYLRKWVVLGAIIGIISGVGAAVFFVALDLASRFFLGTIAGYVPASPLGEGARPITEAARPWVIPLVVALGGLISGLIVFRFAPEAEGHGTDAAISAFHHAARRIRGRIPLVKLVASAITIGSGGSGGREGPTAQIGAGFGSFLARVLDLDARDARIAVSTGMGAGIGAIFRAPLGGAVLAVEIPYREDVEADALVPAFIGSIVAYSVFGSTVGFSPIFGRVSGAGFTDPRQLIYYSLIGLAAGLVGRLYIGSFYGLTRWCKGWSIPRAVRPAVAGLAVGGLALLLPGVLGTGYGWVQAGLDRTTLLGLPLWVIPAGDAVRAPRAILRTGETIVAARARLEAAAVPGAPVIGADGAVRGSIDLATLTSVDPATTVGGLAVNGPLVSADDALDDVLAALADAHRSWAPVVEDGRLAGIISARDVVSAYRRALAANVRQVRAIGSTGALVEAEIGPTSVLAGSAVAAAAWPRDTLLVSIGRGDRLIVPRGDVRLEAGDRLTVFSAPGARDALAAVLASQVAKAEEEPE